MIDKNKIAKAARKCLAAFRKANPDGYLSSIIDIESNCLKNFKEGAKWAINDFLKDLWHPASEEPKKVKNLLLETTYEYGKPIYHLIKYMPNGNNVCAWREWYKGAHISRWLYIDDLLPKEGGNHD